MNEMTSRERIGRMFARREADRVPLFETPWGSTTERWRAEGMGEADYVDFFGLDRIVGFTPDTSPQLPEETVEETEDYIVQRTEWGAVQKNWKHQASTPEMVDVRIKTADDWYAVKDRVHPTEDRIHWERMRGDFARWRDQGAWVQAVGWFGFDITHAHVVGTERLLIALATEPEWIVDMWQTQLDTSLALHDRLWDAGLHADCFKWYDDMGYKQKTFFSLGMYRELLKPIHQQAIDWAHAHDIPAYLHSCGDITPFVPDLVEMGLDALNPLEVKAGMDPLAVKREYGDRLLLHGGFNALLWKDVDRMAEAGLEILPQLMAGGGYIFATDHSTPSEVSLDQFRRIVELVKEVGRY